MQWVKFNPESKHMKIEIITHRDCIKHEMGPYHPEAPGRLESIINALKASNLSECLNWKEASQATRTQIMGVHDERYINSLFKLSPHTGYVPLDPDTAMNPDTLNAALHAAGAIIDAVEDIFSGKTKRAFCAVRPPGHHAEPAQAMGFCFFNNVAIGVSHALNKYACQRIAIVDFDVHHGNGTESMFMGDPRVCLWSSFQHPFYPGTKLFNKPEHIHLVPLDAGTSSEAYRDKVNSDLIPILENFKPEMIFISAGFDAHHSDPLANLNFKTEDYYFITHAVCKVADKYSQGRVISTLEGGYNLKALSESVVAHVRALCEE